MITFHSNEDVVDFLKDVAEHFKAQKSSDSEKQKSAVTHEESTYWIQRTVLSVLISHTSTELAKLYEAEPTQRAGERPEA